MYLAFVLCVWIIFAIIFIDWNNWQSYYSTVLYYCVLNLLYDFIYYNHTLFAFKAITTSYLNYTIINLAFVLIIVPIAITIFLQKLPKKKEKIIGYIFIWAVFFWIIEYIFALKSMFVYDNGWSVWHSAWFDVLMFALLYLHYKRPTLTLGLTVIAIAIFITIFPVPLASLK